MVLALYLLTLIGLLWSSPSFPRKRESIWNPRDKVDVDSRFHGNDRFDLVGFS